MNVNNFSANLFKFNLLKYLKNSIIIFYTESSDFFLLNVSTIMFYKNYKTFILLHNLSFNLPLFKPDPDIFLKLLFLSISHKSLQLKLILLPNY